MDMFKDGLLKGKRILVTGGGTGLGEVMSEAYAKLGATVYICGRRAGVLDETAKKISDATGSKVKGIACDIRVAEAVEDTIAQIWDDGGALTGLVNNAAGNFISRTKDLSPRGFNAIADITLWPDHLYLDARAVAGVGSASGSIPGLGYAGTSAGQPANGVTGLTKQNSTQYTSFEVSPYYLQHFDTYGTLKLGYTFNYSTSSNNAGLVPLVMPLTSEC